MSTLVVLAAGLGARYGGLKQCEGFGPAGETIPEYAVFDALRTGITKVVFVVRRAIEDELRARVLCRFEDRIASTCVFQEPDALPAGFAAARRTKPWGTGQALAVAASEIDGPFAVVNGDDLYGPAAFVALAGFRRAAAPDEGCVVAYRLAKTLSPAGPVSRGVCRVGEDDSLERVDEYHGLERGIAGVTGIGPSGPSLLPGDAPVSMNFWGLPAAVAAAARDDFAVFLRSRAETRDADDAELYLPELVTRHIDKGSLRVRVLPVDSPWCGVTHAGDRERVAAFLRERVAAGDYPERLWE